MSCTPCLDKFVTVDITRQTSFPSGPNFSGVLIFTTEAVPFVEACKQYGSPSELIDDGFLSTGVTYLKALQLFTNGYTGFFKVGSQTFDATLTLSLDAINEFDDAWYFIVETSNLEANILEIAAWTEAQCKMFAALTDDADVANGVGGNTFEDLQGFGYDRTFGLWHHDLTQNGEAAWTGLNTRFANRVAPGANTWFGQSLTGVIPSPRSSLSTAQKNTILGYDGNTYAACGATLGRTENGTVFSGEYIDIIYGTDWLSSIISQNVFALLDNAFNAGRKIAYVDSDLLKVKDTIQGALEQGVASGLITSDYEINVPLAADISFQDKAQRCLNVTFEAKYAGAVHKVGIAGNITL